MLQESRNTITVPSTFILRILAYLNRRRRRESIHTELCLSHDVPRKDVLRLFDEAAFGALWDDDFAHLEIAEQIDAYAGWFGAGYVQTKRWAEGYFYDRDCRGEDLSVYQDDDGEELRYHACEDSTGRFGLCVEVWSDGDTDVSLDVDCPQDVIESMWPGEGEEK